MSQWAVFCYTFTEIFVLYNSKKMSPCCTHLNCYRWSNQRLIPGPPELWPLVSSHSPGCTRPHPLSHPYSLIPPGFISMELYPTPTCIAILWILHCIIFVEILHCIIFFVEYIHIHWILSLTLAEFCCLRKLRIIPSSQSKRGSI